MKPFYGLVLKTHIEASLLRFAQQLRSEVKLNLPRKKTIGYRFCTLSVCVVFSSGRLLSFVRRSLVLRFALSVLSSVTLCCIPVRA